MMEPLILQHHGLTARIDFDEQDRPRLIYFGPSLGAPSEVPNKLDAWQLLAIQGEQANGRCWVPMGAKRHQTLPGMNFRCEKVERTTNDQGLELCLHLRCEQLVARLHWWFVEALPIVRAWVEVENTGSAPHGLELVGSFLMHGLLPAAPAADWPDRARVHYCHHRWCGELAWESRSVVEVGLRPTREQSSSRFLLSNAGHWSTKEHLPMGGFENGSGACYFWQIEHNGSWSWELADHARNLYLLLSGPNEHDHHWFQWLQPGKIFSSVPVAIGAVTGRFEEGLGHLNAYRRILRRANRDNRELPVIFNDYMNCLFADPTTEKERPYLKAAAGAGCEIYTIDAGWYAAQGEGWWSTVGAWQPSKDRFEGGIHGILGEIRQHGMVPGLWLELEVMGVDCPLAQQWPDECFFLRHGKRVISRGRYQLDYRHPTVRAHADEVVDRLVGDYGVGYIKMDYNIEPGLGTEVNADSFGDGLLQHNRAYLSWLDQVFDRYPNLVIENCSSGGLRMDYALLQRHSIQSISDQEDVGLMAKIAVAGPSGATPEQQAVWVYPTRKDSREQVILNCVNGLLMRMHVSGELANLSPENRALVAEAIAVYQEIRPLIPQATPVWPRNLADADADWAALGLLADHTLLLAVWNHSLPAGDISVDLADLLPDPIDSVEPLFPRDTAAPSPRLENHRIILQLPAAPAARLLRIKTKV